MFLCVKTEKKLKYTESNSLMFFETLPKNTIILSILDRATLMSEFQRAHRRYSLSSVGAVVAGEVCPVINVSAGGILIKNWKTRLPPARRGLLKSERRLPMGCSPSISPESWFAYKMMAAWP